jgi:hypothetical protein
MELDNYVVGITTLKERSLAHKQVYLLQELGVELDYVFDLFYEGVYSVDLSTKIYNLNKLGFDDLVCRLTRESKSSYEDLIKAKPQTVSSKNWLELLTSIIFLHKTGFDIYDPDFFKRLGRRAFMRSDVDRAFDLIKQVGLCH